MAEFVETLNNESRMCDYYYEYNSNCGKCGLSYLNNPYELSCSEFIAKHPKEAETIINKWAEEHPVLTNREKFKEVFGIEITVNNICSDIRCPKNRDVSCSTCDLNNFWSKTYENHTSN